MFCCCYYEATATVVTVLCSYYFLRRKVMFAAWREGRLWPPTPGKCLSGGLQIRQCCCCWTIGKWHQDGLPWHGLTASVIPQMPHGSCCDGKELGTENKSQRWDVAVLSPVCSRGQGSFVLSQPPRSASSPAKEKDGLIPPKPFFLGYRLEECKARKSKKHCI